MIVITTKDIKNNLIIFYLYSILKYKKGSKYYNFINKQTKKLPSAF